MYLFKMIALRYIIGIALRVVGIIVGVPGNGLVIIVYLKKRRKTGTDVFILGLAVVDCIVCFSFPLKIYAYVTSQFTSDGLCKFMNFIIYWNTYLGVFLTAVITVDRYLAVCRPLKRRVRPKQAAVIIASCAVVAGFFAIAPVSRTGIVQRGPTVSMCSYYQNATNYAKIIARLNDALYYSCLLLIIVLYTLIWRTVRMRVKVGAHNVSGRIPAVSERVKPTGSVPNTDVSNQEGHAGTSFCKSKIKTVPAGSGDGGLNATGSLRRGSAAETNLEVTAPCQCNETGEVSDRATQQHGDGSILAGGRPAVQLKNKQDPAATRRSNTKTTTMIFIITVIFFVSWVPSKIWSYYPEVRLTWVHTRPVAYDVFFVSLFLINLNQVVNPFVYSFFNAQFRKECVTVARQIGQCRFWN